MMILIAARAAPADAGAFFVTRIKNNARFEVAGQHRPALPKKGVISDERIEYTGPSSVKKYPGKLRLIEFMDDEGKTYQFLTNNFNLMFPAEKDHSYAENSTDFVMYTRNRKKSS